MIDHLAVQCDDLERSAEFYDAVLAALGARRVIDRGDVIGYGTEFPDLWIGRHLTGDRQREVHIAVTAPSRAAVDAFHAIAVSRGAESLHAPRLWPEYHPGYYGAFVRDPDGNNVEAVHHTWGSSTG